MTDAPKGPGWWKASDGQWYAPELHPSASAPGKTEGGVPVPEMIMSSERDPACPNCGTEIVPRASFCTACGKSLSQEPEAAVVVGSPLPEPSGLPPDGEGSGPDPQARQSPRRTLLWGVGTAVAVLLVAAGVLAGVHRPNHSKAASAKQDVVANPGTAECSTLLSPSAATQITGASTMRITNEPQTFINVASPTFACHYDANVDGTTSDPGVPDLTKSFILWLWTNQSDAATTFTNYKNNDLNLYNLPADDPVSVQGIGAQAAWSGPGTSPGELLVQANTSNVFVLSALSQGSSESEAQKLVDELTGAQTGTATTTPSSAGSSGTSSPQQQGSATDNTSSAPPLTASPPPSPVTYPTPTSTTTTTVPLPSDQQKFVDDLEALFPATTGAIQSGSLTAQSLATEGEAVCNALTQGSAEIGPTGPGNFSTVYTDTASYLANQQYGPSIPGATGSDSASIVSLAIEDLCSTFVSEIPAGSPGAP